MKTTNEILSSGHELLKTNVRLEYRSDMIVLTLHMQFEDNLWKKLENKFSEENYPFVGNICVLTYN